MDSRYCQTFYASPAKPGGLLKEPGIAYALHRTGHHKAEMLVPFFIGVPSAAAAAHSAEIDCQGLVTDSAILRAPTLTQMRGPRPRR